MNIVIFDGDNLLSRFVYKYKDYDDTQLISSILKNIQSTSEDEEADIVFVAFDSGKSKYRLSIYPEYKANREKEKTPEFMSLVSKKKNVKTELYNLFQSMGIISVMNYGIEADDIISFICSCYPNNRKYIVSSDMDYYQLVNSLTTIISPIKKLRITPSVVLKETPYITQKDIKRYFIMKKCIYGDPSDNLQGVKGYGPVKTEKLLEKVFTNKMDESDKQFFVEHKDTLTLNRDLINLSKFPDEEKEEIRNSLKTSIMGVDNSLSIDLSYDIKNKYKVNLSDFISGLKFSYAKYKDLISGGLNAATEI